MIKLGKHNTLKVVYKDEYGAYLEGDTKWGNILLPKKYVPSDLEIGDTIKAFIYLDSEDIIIATTQTPYATVGEFATLKVKSIEGFGAFLDWGLDKDLFLPFREQLFKIDGNQDCVVYIYIDSSDRIAASTRINKYIQKTPPPFSENDKVELRVYQFTDLGAKAIINGTHSGVIYKDKLTSQLKMGQVVTGYIKKLRDDGKIDLTLSATGISGRDDLEELILEKLKSSNGTIEVTAKSSSEEIFKIFGVSRKKFKMALGSLYKKQIIDVSDEKTTLK